MIGGIIGAAGGALGGVLGGISRNKMLKQQMKMVNEQKKENQNWYDRRYNEDSTQRADAQAMLTQTAEAIKQRNQASAGSAAVMGGTEESVAATKAANAQAMADATSKIVVAGEQQGPNREPVQRAQQRAQPAIAELAGAEEGRPVDNQRCNRRCGERFRQG